MIAFFGKLFGKGKNKGKVGTLKGSPITCLGCKKTYSLKKFAGTNGVCKCGEADFSFLTDDVPDDELAANKHLSEGAKFVLDADDFHLERVEGRKLILLLRNKGMIK